MSLGQQKSVFLILKPYKTGLKLLRKKSHNLHYFCISNRIICPENFAQFAIFYHTLSEGLYEWICMKTCFDKEAQANSWLVSISSRWLNIGQVLSLCQFFWKMVTCVSHDQYGILKRAMLTSSHLGQTSLMNIVYGIKSTIFIQDTADNPMWSRLPILLACVANHRAWFVQFSACRATAHLHCRHV